MGTRFRQLLLVPLSGIILAGCVDRELNVTSNPPGALVYLNGQEVGRTPLTHEFLWYGNYDVTVRKPGYETLRTTQKVEVPWYQIVPIDLFAEILPVHYKDEQHFDYKLSPLPMTDSVDNAKLLQRAEGMRDDLEGSVTPGRNKPTFKPATRPASKSTTTAKSK